MSTTKYSALYVIGICSVYMFVGPSLILLNKHILSDMNFRYPLFLSSLGVFVSSLFSWLCVKFKVVTLTKKDAIEGILWYKRVLPVGLAHAGTLAFGNFVYLFLNVGTIQMLKSFTPVIILVTGYLAGVEQPSLPIIASVVIICLGTATTCTSTPELSTLGLLIMLLSESGEAIRLILTQYLLQNLKFGVTEGLYVLAPASGVWLGLASLVFEFRDMVNSGAWGVVVSQCHVFILASVIGLGVNFLSYYVIQATSSLTMKVLGTLRNILTIFLGVLLFSERITLSEALGYTVALVGFVLYNAAKMGYLDSFRVMDFVVVARVTQFRIGVSGVLNYCYNIIINNYNNYNNNNYNNNSNIINNNIFNKCNHSEDEDDHSTSLLLKDSKYNNNNNNNNNNINNNNISINIINNNNSNNNNNNNLFHNVSRSTSSGGMVEMVTSSSLQHEHENEHENENDELKPLIINNTVDINNDINNNNHNNNNSGSGLGDHGNPNNNNANPNPNPTPRRFAYKV